VQLFHFEQIDSTQNKARELFDQNTPRPFCVFATSQSQGRGTQARVWHSPNGGLYLSLVLDLDFNIFDTDPLAFCQEKSLGIVKTLKTSLEKYFDNNYVFAELNIKPINDLYFRDAKLAGVLIETFNKANLSTIIIGIGLNIIKVSTADLDRKIISLEEILSFDDFKSFKKEKFAEFLLEKLQKEFYSSKNNQTLT
jgi:BirA family biotin operon repressor/biotin-[acetyl-CoA-carboxylase] ligase